MRLIERAYAFAKEDLKLNWKELSGKASNPLITECYKAVDGLKNPEMIDDSKTAWCSCYVNKKIQDAGGKGTRSPLARSWLKWARESKGNPGDIVVLRRGTSSWEGHVGFLVSKGLIYVEVLGGNQSNEVNISKYLRINVLGYRTSKDVIAQEVVA